VHHFSRTRPHGKLLLQCKQIAQARVLTHQQFCTLSLKGQLRHLNRCLLLCLLSCFDCNHIGSHQVNRLDRLRAQPLKRPQHCGHPGAQTIAQIPAMIGRHQEHRNCSHQPHARQRRQTASKHRRRLAFKRVQQHDRSGSLCVQEKSGEHPSGTATVTHW